MKRQKTPNVTDFGIWQKEKARARRKLLQLPPAKAQKIASAIKPDASINLVYIPDYPNGFSVGGQ